MQEDYKKWSNKFINELERINMNWDEYFLGVCKTIASNSKCLSRKIGAIIVRDKSIISTGYNGPPRGVPPCFTRCNDDQNFIKELNTKSITYDQIHPKCPRQVLGFKSGEKVDICIAGHAERNAIVNAAKNGVCVKDSIMYMTCPIPCTPCLVEIINSGIKEIVVTDMSYYDQMGEYLIKQSGLKVRLNNSIL